MSESGKNNLHNGRKSFWPDSPEENTVSNKGQPLIRSIFKFKSFGALIGAIGKLAGQYIIFWMLFSLLFILLVKPDIWGTDQTYLVVEEITKLITYTISVFLAFRIFEDTGLVDIGLKLNRLALRDFLEGLWIVFLVIAFQFLVYLSFGWIIVKKAAWDTESLSYIVLNILITFVIFCFTGWSEELLSRGYHLRIMSKGFNRYFGILLSSVLFSYLHRNNPGITLQGLIFIFLSGIMFSIAFLRTGQLWLAIGLHTGWDFFGAVIFWGYPVSGLRIFHLMDIGTILQPFAFFFFEVLSLVVLTIAVYIYTSNRKVEHMDW